MSMLIFFVFDSHFELITKLLFKIVNYRFNIVTLHQKHALLKHAKKHKIKLSFKSQINNFVLFYIVQK